MARLMRCAAIALVILSAAAAPADVATWSWEVSDTGNGDGVIEPGESALLLLAMAFDPPQPQVGGGFGYTEIYDIRGNERWSAGTVDEYDNYLDWVSDDGTLDSDNNILHIESFQFPVAFGTVFDNSNPIDLYFIQWTPGTYEPAAVTLENGGPDARIYTDQFGATLLYAGEGGAVSFRVVPAPGAPLLALVAMGWAARRGRGA